MLSALEKDSIVALDMVDATSHKLRSYLNPCETRESCKSHAENFTLLFSPTRTMSIRGEEDLKDNLVYQEASR